MRGSNDLKEVIVAEDMGKDVLQKLLNIQTVLQVRLLSDPDLGWQRYILEDPDSAVTKILIDNADMLMMEAAEAKDWMPWKKHKRDYGRALTEEEREKVLEEFVDALHFVLNGFLTLGVTTSEEVGQRFLAKNKVNHARQDDGY